MATFINDDVSLIMVMFVIVWTGSDLHFFNPNVHVLSNNNNSNNNNNNNNNLLIYSALLNILGDQKRITTINNVKTI